MKPLELFHNYMGTGLILVWYFAALIYLLLRERERDKRILFVYVPAIMLLLFFNPLFFRVFQKFSEEGIYYRLIWLIPVTVTIAYWIVRICGQLKGKARALFCVVSAILIMISGTLTYSSPIFTRTENLEHVPSEVVEICDMIVVPGREVMAAFPLEMLHFVRQYTPWVCLPFGREVLTGGFSELEYCMRYRQIDVETMAKLAKEEGCHYLIISEEKELLGDMTAYDYELLGKVGKYLVYRDNTMDFSLE